MKKLAVLAKKFSIDSHTLSAVFIGYLVLLLAGALLLSSEQTSRSNSLSKLPGVETSPGMSNIKP